MDVFTELMNEPSWGNQLKSVIQAWGNGTAVQNCSISYMMDKGVATRVSLDPAQQQISMDQSKGLLVSLNDTQPWAITDGAVKNAVVYIFTNLLQQQQLAAQWYADQQKVSIQ